MQSSSKPVADVSQIGADILRVTLRQLRAWDEAAARDRVVQPKADEEAWEGTEIDVRRTVL